MSFGLIGREQEVLAIVEPLRGDEVRLLTLTGPGGVGKTRLATGVADLITASGEPEVSFVSLAPLRDAPLVISAMARVLGVRDSGNRSLFETVGDYLRDRRAVLFIDNCEHVLQGMTALSALLEGCPLLKVLATSRERLRLRWEQIYDVRPLALPNHMDADVGSRRPCACSSNAPET